MNIYLDIDGVLLTKELKQMPNSAELIAAIFLIPNVKVYWLTIHGKDGTIERVLRHIGNSIDQETYTLLLKVLPTKWQTLKTEAIDFTQDFLWFDDWILVNEREVLKKHNVWKKWLQVQNNLEDLQQFLPTTPTPAV